jgi:5-methylthioadenosine/S-adenosylhomocysteine deaminase
MDWADRIGRRIKLRDLHILLAVAECGSMAKASSQLSVSHPVVSKTISELERTLGVRLLDRSSQGVELTRHGAALLKLGLMASFHVACAKHGPRPQSMQSLAEQHLLGPDINLVHANFLTPDEFRVAANNGTSVSITPEVEMQMGLGLPPTGAALAARVNLNIGTDVVTGVSTDMFTQMRFLLQTQRALANETFHKRETMPDRLTITAQHVLELATIKSAQCIGLDRRIGSLSPGKQADVILLRKTDINMRAAADPMAAIVLHAGVSNVDTVIVNGNIVKQDGKLTYRDLGRRLTDLERSSDRLYAAFASDASAA